MMKVDDGTFSHMGDNDNLPGHTGTRGEETEVEEKAKQSLVGEPGLRGPWVTGGGSL